VLNVECTNCARKGRYHVQRLIEVYGRKGGSNCRAGASDFQFPNSLISGDAVPTGMGGRGVSSSAAINVVADWAMLIRSGFLHKPAEQSLIRRTGRLRRTH